METVIVLGGGAPVDEFRDDMDWDTSHTVRSHAMRYKIIRYIRSSLDGVAPVVTPFKTSTTPFLLSSSISSRILLSKKLRNSWAS